MEEIPSLAALINKIKSFAKRYEFVPSIDNRKIFIRKFNEKVLDHTALNAKLQADGSIVTKRAMFIANNEIKNRNIPANQIIFYHDEYAYESSPEYGDEIGRILVESMKKSGEFYNLRIPIDGKYAVGKDWSVH